MNNSKLIFSVFSGSFYRIPEADFLTLKDGQIPLTKSINNNCKKCYGRGHSGRDKNTLIYSICNCLRKNVDLKSYRELEKKLST
jgi:hypothetical protein